MRDFLNEKSKEKILVRKGHLRERKRKRKLNGISIF